MASEKVKSGTELEGIGQEKGRGEKLKNAAARIGAGALDVAGDLAHLWKGANAAPLQERLQRGAAILRGEGAGTGDGDDIPAKGNGTWVERGEWIRLFERYAVAREIGAKVSKSMSADAWAWILGAPWELAKSNLRDLEALLSGQEGWKSPLVNVAGRLQAYEHALDGLRRLPDGEEEQLPRLHRATKRTLEELMSGLVELASGASRVQSGDVR